MTKVPDMESVGIIGGYLVITKYILLSTLANLADKKLIPFSTHFSRGFLNSYRIRSNQQRPILWRKLRYRETVIAADIRLFSWLVDLAEICISGNILKAKSTKILSC